MKLSLTTLTFLLLLASTTAIADSTSSPSPSPSSSSDTPKDVKEGGSCNIDLHRLVCEDDKKILFCVYQKWHMFAHCTRGTKCKDGYCVNDSKTKRVESDTKNPSSSAPTDSSTDSSASPGSSSSSSSSSSDSNPTNAPGDNQGSKDSPFGITCSKFDKAVADASKSIGQNYPKPSNPQCNNFLSGLKSKGGITSAREAAMFLANILWESDGLQAKEEIACKDKPKWCAQNYKTPQDAPGKTYWGRGYIQLSWEYNYKAASKALFGDNRLVEDPKRVAQNDNLAWAVSFWFWKENVHGDEGVQKGQFGSSVNKINGALECKGAAKDKAKKRYTMYKAVLKVFAPDQTPIESGCYN